MEGLRVKRDVWKERHKAVREDAGRTLRETKRKTERKSAVFLFHFNNEREAGRRGCYRPGINQDQNRVTERRERTAAAGAHNRSDLGLHCEYKERDHDYPEKAQMSGKS